MNTTIAVLGVWLVAVKLVAGWLWWQNRGWKRTAAAYAQLLLDAGTERDALQQTLAVWVGEATTLRRRLLDVATLVTRRPPRRRWLALARRVARTAVLT